MRDSYCAHPNLLELRRLSLRPEPAVAAPGRVQGVQFRAACLPDVRGVRHLIRQTLPGADCRGSPGKDPREFL